MGTPLVIRFKERQDSRIERRNEEKELAADTKGENQEEKPEKKLEAYGHRKKKKEAP